MRLIAKFCFAYTACACLWGIYHGNYWLVPAAIFLMGGMGLFALWCANFMEAHEADMDHLDGLKDPMERVAFLSGHAPYGPVNIPLSDAAEEQGANGNK